MVNKNKIAMTRRMLSSNSGKGFTRIFSLSANYKPAYKIGYVVHSLGRHRRIKGSVKIPIYYEPLVIKGKSYDNSGPTNFKGEPRR